MATTTEADRCTAEVLNPSGTVDRCDAAPHPEPVHGHTDGPVYTWWLGGVGRLRSDSEYSRAEAEGWRKAMRAAGLDLPVPQFEHGPLYRAEANRD